MTKMLEIYKCEKCGNIVEIYHEADGDLVCCGENMIRLDEKTADMTTEKHVPMIEAVEGGYKVTVGSTLHPMIETHYIEWIQLVTEKQVMMQFLKPGDEPIAVFKTDDKPLYAREYCNIHSLWKS